MKTNKLAKIAGAIVIPVLAGVSGCAGTLKGITHDTGYIATRISDAIYLKEKPAIIDSPVTFVPDGQGGYKPIRGAVFSNPAPNQK